jgi:hypothetical protein
VSKEQSWFNESQRFLTKIAECEKQQMEANEKLEKLNARNHR